jgi:hypothetical protein
MYVSHVNCTDAGEGVRYDSSLNSENNATRSLFFFIITTYHMDLVLGTACAQLVGGSRR